MSAAALVAYQAALKEGVPDQPHAGLTTAEFNTAKAAEATRRSNATSTKAGR